ncbi:ATP-binding protein [Streptomyces sp. SGAir0957]
MTRNLIERHTDRIDDVQLGLAALLFDRVCSRLSHEQQGQGQDPVVRDLVTALGDVLLIARSRGTRLDTGRTPDDEGAELRTFPGDTFASAQDARRFVRDVAVSWALPAQAVHDLEVVAGELAGNAVVHGGDDVVAVSVTRRTGFVTVCVTDGGGRVGDPVQPVAARDDDESGRGLVIVEALAERWGWRRTGRGGLAVWARVAAAAPSR